jgi:hypothetical protein
MGQRNSMLENIKAETGDPASEIVSNLVDSDTASFGLFEGAHRVKFAVV